MMRNKTEFIFGHTRLLIIPSTGFALYCFFLPFLLLQMYRGWGKVAVESENKKISSFGRSRNIPLAYRSTLEREALFLLIPILSWAAWPPAILN